MRHTQPRDHKAEAETRRKLRDITRQIVAGHRAAKATAKTNNKERSHVGTR
jgi:hypothetical protein